MRFKQSLILLFLFNGLLGYGQSEYYQLVKNGEKFPKPLCYIKEGVFPEVKSTDKGVIYFHTKANSFIHDPQIHVREQISDAHYEGLRFITPPELYEIETGEFKEKADLIQGKSGFRPVPPVKHFILKVFVIREINGQYWKYEVEWKYGE